MALVIRGKTPCGICGSSLGAGDEIRAFPAFLPADHPFARFSDGAFHRSCFDGMREAGAVWALYARYRATWDSRPEGLSASEFEAWGREAFKDFGAGVAPESMNTPLGTHLELVTNGFELLALHRALMEARFTLEANDPAVPDSPLVAAVANRVVDALIDLGKQSKGYGTAEEWIAWRRVDPTRREWRVVVNRLARNRSWQKQSREEKAAQAAMLMSPFVLTQEQLDQLVSEAESLGQIGVAQPPLNIADDDWRRMMLTLNSLLVVLRLLATEQAGNADKMWRILDAIEVIPLLLLRGPSAWIDVELSLRDLAREFPECNHALERFLGAGGNKQVE